MAQFGSSLRRPPLDNLDDIAPRADGDGASKNVNDADNVVTFPTQPPAQDGSATALDLIYRAAEMFAGVESRARDIEANARAMCQSAVDKLLDAERRVQAAERARQDIISDVDRRLQDVAIALSDAQERIDAANARTAAAEARATTAEAEAQTARRLLAKVEDAIRSRLLGEDADMNPLRRTRA
jgi:hypothetical protein